MNEKQKLILLFLFVSLFLVGIRVSIDFPLGAGIYQSLDSVTNPEGIMRFTTGPFCGNGRLDPGEQCDDGNRIDGDGCSSNCTFEGPYCGDGNLDPGEECDDGNNVNGDGCSATCKKEKIPPPPGGGGDGKRRVPPPVPPVTIEIPAIPALRYVPCLVHEIPMPVLLDQLLSYIWIRIKVPTQEDLPYQPRVNENPNFEIRLSSQEEGTYYTNIWSSQEGVKDITSSVEAMMADSDEWNFRSLVNIWWLNVSEWIDLPIIAENLMLRYRPIHHAWFTTDNKVLVNVTTRGTGEESGTNITVNDIIEIAVTSPVYFAKVTEVVDGYIGVYFVIDGYNLRTVDDEYIVDFEINLDDDLYLGDILQSQKLTPNRYNVVYRRYKLPDIPKQGMYKLTSRIYEKGMIFSRVVKTYYDNVDFRKQTPTERGKTII